MSQQPLTHQQFFQNCVEQCIKDSGAFLNAVAKGARISIAADEAGVQNAGQLINANQALKALEQHQGALEKIFPQALQKFFENNSNGSKKEIGQDKAPASAFGELSLMEDHAVVAHVELTRVRQIVKNITEADLSILNAYACSAMGLNSVQPERNPLRPENYIRALQFVVDESCVAFDLRQLWMQHMGATLGHLLVSLYRGLTLQLKQHGVKKVGYVVASPTRKSQPAATPASPDANQPVASAAQVTQAQADRIRDEVDGLLQDISQLQALGEQLTGASGFQALESAAANAQTMQAPQIADVSATVAAGMQSTTVMLARMLDLLTQNERMPQALRQVIRNLELSLTRLVERDASFFTNTHHAARKLLNSLIRRGLAYPDEKAPGFDRFVRFASDTVSYLTALPVHDVTAFEYVNRMWEHAWAKRAAAQTDGPSKLPDSVEELVQQNATEFTTLHGAQYVSSALLEFLGGPWSEVVAYAQLTGEKRNVGRYRTAVPMLLWCAQPQHSRDDARRLLALVEGLSKSIRTGLESISYPAPQIEQISQRISRLRIVLARRAEIPELRERIGLDDEATASSRGDTALSNLAEESRTQNSGTIISVATLEIGQWFELWLQSRTVRTQLSWTSPHKTSFMFTALDGSTQSLTLRMLTKLASDGAVVRIDDPYTASSGDFQITGIRTAY